MATNAENIDTAIANLAILIATKTAEWIDAGMPPQFSLDGLSVNWNEWLRGMSDNLKSLQELRQTLAGPFIHVSRTR